MTPKPDDLSKALQLLPQEARYATASVLAEALIKAGEYRQALALLGNEPAAGEPDAIARLRMIARRSDMDAQIFSAVYSPRSRLLWVKGRFQSSRGRGTVALFDAQGRFLGHAHVGQRSVYWNDKYAGWVFEDVIPHPLAEGEQITARCTDAGGEVMTVQGNITIDGTHKVPADRADTREPATERPSQTIVLAIHNLDVEHRRDKLECFEALHAALSQFGWRLVALNHSPFPLQTSLPHVNFSLDQPPADSIPESCLTGPECEEALFEAVTLRFEFERELGLTPTWDATRTAVLDEARRFEIYLRHFRPHLALLWHQWNSFAHMNRFVCDHYRVPSLFAHEGFLPGTLGLDPLGEMAESSIARAPEAFRALPVEHADLDRARRLLSHYRQTSADRKPQVHKGMVARLLAPLNAAGKKVVFYAGVNDWQTGMLPSWWPRAAIHSPRFVNTLDALTELLAVAESEDFHVLFKPHPNVKPPANLPQSERLLVVRDANVVECIAETALTISLFSTVNYIAMINGKPVVLLGRSSMTGAGVAYELEETGGLAPLMRQALAGEGWAEKNDAWERHVAALMRHYLFPYGPGTEERLGRTHRDTARYLLRQCGPGLWPHLAPESARSR